MDIPQRPPERQGDTNQRIDDEEEEDEPPRRVKAFSEADHPRGQPGNAGQFGPGGAAHQEASSKLRESQAGNGLWRSKKDAEKWAETYAQEVVNGAKEYADAMANAFGDPEESQSVRDNAEQALHDFCDSAGEAAKEKMTEVWGEEIMDRVSMAALEEFDSSIQSARDAAVSAIYAAHDAATEEDEEGFDSALEDYREAVKDVDYALSAGVASLFDAAQEVDEENDDEPSR